MKQENLILLPNMLPKFMSACACSILGPLTRSETLTWIFFIDSRNKERKPDNCYIDGLPNSDGTRGTFSLYEGLFLSFGMTHNLWVGMAHNLWVISHESCGFFTRDGLSE